jgi:hypothetical protein
LPWPAGREAQGGAHWTREDGRIQRFRRHGARVTCPDGVRCKSCSFSDITISNFLGRPLDFFIHGVARRRLEGHF